MGELIDLDDYKKRLLEKEEQERRLSDVEELEYMKEVVQRIIDILDLNDDGAEPTFFFVPFPSGSQNDSEE